MAEKTFQQGVVEGRLQNLEQTVSERGTDIAGLRTDMNNMGETIRAGFVHAVSTLKDDIKDEITLQIEPVAINAAAACKELQGNGQPGLVKRFERSNTKANLNWGLTILMVGALIKMGLDLWARAPSP